MKTLEDRFWSKVEISDIGSCWFWKGSCKNTGYGQIALYKNGKQKTILAHRLSYEINIGPIPEDLFVMHSCDNPSCVNPNHLSLGTHEDNMLDMKLKERSCCHLSIEERKKIKEEYTATKTSVRKLAAKYNLNRSVIWTALHV